MDKQFHLDFGTTVLLLVSCANLILLLVAFLRPNNDPSTPSARPSPGALLYGTLGPGLACVSQILYLVLGAAWLLRWMHFYPGNPIETYSILAGLLSSTGAFATAFLTTGRRRFAAIFVAITTGGLWLLSAIASVAI
jgi:hypothetical protein